MRGYGQFCPIAKAAEVLGERWTHLIVRELITGSERFNDLRKGLPLISPSLLSTRLKFLERQGVISRCEDDSGVRYQLTEAGRELKPIIMQLGVWGHRWVRSNLSPEDLDPSLLVWDIHRHIDTGHFAAKRTTIHLEFDDCPPKQRYYWLVVSQGDVDVCMKDPGYPVELTINTDLRSLTAVWMGDESLGHAVRSGRIVVKGSSKLKNTMTAWLGASDFAEVKAAR